MVGNVIVVVWCIGLLEYWLLYCMVCYCVLFLRSVHGVAVHKIVLQYCVLGVVLA
jgi:hypothetical protein